METKIEPDRLRSSSDDYRQIQSSIRRKSWPQVFGRLFIAAFEAVSTTNIGKRFSNVQLQRRYGRAAARSITILGSIAAGCILSNANWMVRAFDLMAVCLLFILSFGMRFPNAKSRVIGFVGFQRIELHLLRINGIRERRRFKIDLHDLIKDGLSAGVHTFVLSSPHLCRPRAKERIMQHVEIVLNQCDRNGWKTEVHEPEWLSVLSSLNFCWNYGDTLPMDYMMTCRKPFKLIGRIPIGVKLLQSQTIRFTKVTNF